MFNTVLLFSHPRTIFEYFWAPYQYQKIKVIKSLVNFKLVFWSKKYDTSESVVLLRLKALHFCSQAVKKTYLLLLINDNKSL